MKTRVGDWPPSHSDMLPTSQKDPLLTMIRVPIESLSVCQCLPEVHLCYAIAPTPSVRMISYVVYRNVRDPATKMARYG